MDEIIKHDEEQTPIKVSLDSVPVVRQSNVEISDFEETLQQCLYHMRDIVRYESYRCIYQQNAYFLSRAISSPNGFLATWKNLCLYEEPGRLAFAQGLLKTKVQEYMFSYKEKEEQLDSYFSVNKLAAEYDEEFKNRAQTSLGNLLVPGYFKKIAKSLEPILILLEKKPEEVASSHGTVIIYQTADLIQTNNYMSDGSAIHYHQEPAEPTEKAEPAVASTAVEPCIPHSVLEKLYDINCQMPSDHKKYYFLNIESISMFYDYWDQRPMPEKVSIASGGTNRFLYLIRVLYQNHCIRTHDFEEWLKALFKNTEGLSDMPWEEARKRYATNTVESTKTNDDFKKLLKKAGLSLNSD